MVLADQLINLVLDPSYEP